MKRFLLVAFSMATLMMSWEGQLTSANVLDNGPIPQESIRLRIIANSDRVQDQWLKREVRDAIVDQINVWVKDIESYEEAKTVVAAKLPELQTLVDNTIRERGFSYQAEVDLGRVPFPTKLYGSYVYPAGEYEALRVRIGEAQGQNWWCVLFPPLCFIDMSNGDAVASAQEKRRDAGPARSEQTVFAEDAEYAVDTETGDDAEDAKNDTDVSVHRPAWDERAAYQEWRLSRLDRSWSRVSEQQDGHSAGVETATSTTDAVAVTNVDTAPEQPQVEVRFYLWEKLAALF